MSKSKKHSSKMNRTHLRTLTVRMLRQTVTNVPSLIMMILQAPMLLLIVSLVYVKDSFLIADKVGYANTVLFIMVFIGSLMGILNSYRCISKEREILNREAAGGLDLVAYLHSKYIVLGLIAFVQSLILVFGSFIFIKYNMQHPMTDTMLYILAEFLVILSSSALGLLISAALKNSESAILPVLLVIICQVVFSGVLFELSGPIKNVSYLVPTTWGVALMGNILRLNHKLPHYTRAVFDHGVIECLVVLILLTLVCYSITIALLKGKNRRKK